MANKQFFNFNRAMLLLFIIASFIIIKAAFTSENPNLEQEANMVMAKLTNSDEISLLSSDEIDAEKLSTLDEMDYNEVKGMLGIKNDFCIYFEDEDGALVKIDGTNPGIGSGKILINGEPCR